MTAFAAVDICQVIRTSSFESTALGLDTRAAFFQSPWSRHIGISPRPNLESSRPQRACWNWQTGQV
jgi:hypothetical protein